MSKVVKTYIDENKGVIATTITEIGFWEDSKYTGKSKCSPEDIFNVELGKKLSLARAWLKLDKGTLKLIKNEQKELEKRLAELAKEEEAQIKIIERTENKIQELVDSTEE